MDVFSLMVTLLIVWASVIGAGIVTVVAYFSVFLFLAVYDYCRYGPWR